MPTVVVAACQMPEIRDDIQRALSLIAEYTQRADAQGARLVCFPECFLQGYFVSSDQEREHACTIALDLSSHAFQQILLQLADLRPMLVFGLIEADADQLYNTAVVIQKGELVERYRKKHLLGGESFFASDGRCPIIEIDGLRFGLNICYDTAHPDPAQAVASQGADLILCLANNMHVRETSDRIRQLHNDARGERCRETALWMLSSDVTGERDDRVSYGPTALLNPQGEVVAQVPLLQPGLIVEEVPYNSRRSKPV
ncbi:MAG: carbon-nitrogen hydrolase family protein [Gemmatimonadetes bacterium]|jgi:predicted amidohydrolase|nr:carbon-nitrogen hydrolase family protein [Gemmatimonadota bacterium]MBT4611087.1 carbon-nitrogen hydrolase family protein [Gemmatimonadota bacterium]MBT5146518.1 carbon-nitrogen hydrolase family protein [Gemmatimonadota bacterium]MBT5591439.1 carbon-nitrogen hydrolase family protein [Gemmatimonadota bacterium]MBT5962106.1 carbon-nitrogen hydrolase family protein [Gemmatimonadota bacterium]